MTIYQRFKKMNIDHSAIGMEQNVSGSEYFCTPKGAKIIGCAGVDGIHYCFIDGFDEMVFAVSPESVPGEYVHPIAKNFEDLLRLLLACGSMDAIEQTYMWDEELFEQYIMDNQPRTVQREILDILRAEFQIAPMEQPYAYIKGLQRSFDYSELKFSDEYYELIPQAEVTEESILKWKVTYEGGFYPKRGRAGKEIRVDRERAWSNAFWHIPSVYICTKGLVVDYCIEVEPDLVKRFIDKWHLYEEQNREYSHSDYEKIQEEHPLNMEFHSKVFVNGDELYQKQGCAVYWIPKEYEMAKIPCEPFVAPKAGENHMILNPVTGMEYTLTVQAYEEREMDPNHFQDDSMEWPTNYAIMTYTLFPELDDFMLQDANQGDSPRRKQTSPHGPMASSVGIIGLRPKADDGEEYFYPDGTVAKLRVCCSGMYFEKPETIKWKLTLREKQVPDICVELI